MFVKHYTTTHLLNETHFEVVRGALKARGFNEKRQQGELVEATLLHSIGINESFLSLCQGSDSK